MSQNLPYQVWLSGDYIGSVVESPSTFDKILGQIRTNIYITRLIEFSDVCMNVD